MSSPSEYTGQNPKNCGYRTLDRYYQDMAGISVLSGQKRPEFVVTASWGGTPYSVSNATASEAGSGDVLCNTWRRGQCCDQRAVSRNAYSNCMSGVCPSYVARSAYY